jgi:ethanolamine ammonia-lyase small subunit
MPDITIPDPWDALRRYTDARIALGRSGNAIPLKRDLEFRLAHAHARDAVHTQMDTGALLETFASSKLPSIVLKSQATDRLQYLQRPDLGRLPDEASVQRLDSVKGSYDVCIIIADGLSANAINTHAARLCFTLVETMQAASLTLAPVCVIEQCRVAMSDPVGALVGCRIVVMLIGERPGLSAADSVGAYITYDPKPGLTDDARNCVSNIRPGGLNYEPAVKKIFYLVQQSLQKRISGVTLKDNAGLIE